MAEREIGPLARRRRLDSLRHDIQPAAKTIRS
jgi:hypothetical protein